MKNLKNDKKAKKIRFHSNSIEFRIKFESFAVLIFRNCKNNSKFFIIVQLYGTSNVPNKFLIKSLSLVRYGSRESLYKKIKICMNFEGIK